MYMSRLRFNIQDEISLNAPNTIEECYKLATKDTYKLRNKQARQVGGINQSNRGRASKNHEGQDKNNLDNGNEPMIESISGQRGGSRLGVGRGASSFSGKCYNCGSEGHPFFKYPEKDPRRSDKRVILAQGKI